MSELFTSGSVGGMGRKPCPYPEGHAVTYAGLDASDRLQYDSLH